jgi:GAF domain-containing protein
MPELVPLLPLLAELDRGEIDSGAFLAQFTVQLAGMVGCTRAGVWMFQGGGADRALHCVSLYDVNQRAHVPATDMLAADVQDYFDALLRDGCVIADDAFTHPATVGFRDEYLLPQDVRSIMDVCFTVNGVMLGTFCCEQVGQRVTWSAQQLQTLRKVAARTSLALLRAASATVDTAPGALWEPAGAERLAGTPEPPPPR